MLYRLADWAWSEDYLYSFFSLHTDDNLKLYTVIWMRRI